MTPLPIPRSTSMDYALLPEREEVRECWIRYNPEPVCAYDTESDALDDVGEFGGYVVHMREVKPLVVTDEVVRRIRGWPAKNHVYFNDRRLLADDLIAIGIPAEAAP